MKRSLRYTFFFIVIAVVLAVFCVTASAAPAKPGTHANGGACRSHTGTLLTLSEISETAAKRSGAVRAPELDPATSDLPLAVIVIGLSDMPYREDYDWAKEIFRSDKSLAEYYTDMSFGKFTFTPVRETSAYGDGNTNTADAVNDGVIHVTVPLPHDDWRMEYTFLSPRDKETMLTFDEAMFAAIEAADAYIDFSAYDANNDGAITTDEMALAFVVAGYEAATSEAYELGNNCYLWSNAYSFGLTKAEYRFTFDLPQADGVTLDSYIAISEQNDDGTQASIGILAHELGHYLGLPDLYDTNYRSYLEWGKYGVGYLSLMDTGGYGIDPETGAEVPYSLDIWSRVILGWTEPVSAAADEKGDFTLVAQNYENDENFTALRIATENPEEYYLLENRSFTKLDAGLANEFNRENGGIILWHIDDAVWDDHNADNSVNNADHRPCVMPLYAEITDGEIFFTGKNTRVDQTSAFFDKTVWETKYASFGDALDLPVYGTGENADKRSGRTFSGIRLQFLTDPAFEMQVRLNPTPHVHEPVYTEVTAPTCTAAGSAYYLCSCGKLFADAEGSREITAPFAVDPLGHTAPNADGQCDRCHTQLVQTPVDPPVDPPAPQDPCPYCHSPHTGAFGSLVAFFHRILYFFAHLFGKM